MENGFYDIPMSVPHEYEIINLQREIIKAKDETISLLKVIVKNYANQKKGEKTNETI